MKRAADSGGSGSSVAAAAAAAASGAAGVGGSLADVLRHATLLCSELRTSSLTPKVYYELYMDVFDALGFLDVHFAALARGGLPLARLYEAVQLTGNVLPRAYLMVTAGAVYIRSGQGPAKDVLADLLEMVKGVQHPQRGLFLRHFLAQKCKDKLPDVGSSYEGARGEAGESEGWGGRRGERLRGRRLPQIGRAHV